MADNSRASMSDDDDDEYQAQTKPNPAFTGYRSFPPTINLYSNFSGIINALTTFKLCGADKSDVLYIVEMHHGFTPRGPLNFRPGLYLRNGTSKKAPILAAAGDESRAPLLVSTVSLKSVIMLPPFRDIEHVNPRDLVTEIMHATTDNSDHSVSFRFSVEVGVKMAQREEFEWRKPNKKVDATSLSADDTAANKTTTHHTRYILSRYRPSATASSSSSSSAASENETLAELVFTNVMSWNHMFTLEMKGPGRSGELGDRWTLMVVATALRMYWLRVYGKTNKVVVGTGEKIRGK